MLTKYYITDSQAVDYGLLTYDSTTAEWRVEINPKRTWEDTPFSLAIYIKHGIYSLDTKQSLSWIRDRLAPPNRQNINAMLQSLGIERYDEFVFIQKTMGKSPNDGMYLIPVED